MYYAKWSKRKTNTVWIHLYVESKKKNKWTNIKKTAVDAEDKQVVGRGDESGRGKK